MADFDLVVRKLTLAPGDVVVVESTLRLDMAQATQIREALRVCLSGACGVEVPVVVLSRGFTLASHAGAPPSPVGGPPPQVSDKLH